MEEVKDEVKKDVKVDATPTDKPKKKKSLKLKLILFLILIIIAAGATCYFMFFPKTIDISECIEVSYDGYDGNAVASVKIKKDKLKEKIKDEDVAKSFIKKAKIDISDNKKLSNGDEIEISIDISDSFLKEHKLKLKEDTIKYKVSGLSKTSKIDLSKYVEIEYEGYNGFATAEVSLSNELKEIIGKDNFSDMKEEISFKVIDNGSLENDTDMEVEVDISDSWLEKHGIELKSSTLKIEVTGLDEGKVVDAFESMKVELTGMSPNLQLSISNTSTDPFIKTVVFTPAKTSKISNGETVKITITNYDKTLAEKEGYTFKEKSIDYKVGNQASFISKSSEFTPAIISKIKTDFTSKALSYASETSNFYDNEAYGKHERVKHDIRVSTDYKYVSIDKNTTSIDKDLQAGTPELVSLYLLTKKDANAKGDLNRVKGIVKIPYTSSVNGTTYNWYITVSAANFSIKEDGTISENAVYTISNENGKDEEAAYQKWINGDKDNYEVEKISIN